MKCAPPGARRAKTPETRIQRETGGCLAACWRSGTAGTIASPALFFLAPTSTTSPYHSAARTDGEIHYKRRSAGSNIKIRKTAGRAEATELLSFQSNEMRL
jgi:hypothetical protein